MKKIIILLPVFLLCNLTQAKEYYVATNGKDKNNGTIGSPFKTIEKAIKQLKAGDILYIRGGNYQEEINIDGLKGTKNSPIIITNYQQEKVTLDGTIEIKDWKQEKNNIYKAKPPKPISQLFVDGEWMIMARYPNASFQDSSIWDREKSWLHGDPKASSHKEKIEAYTDPLPYDDITNAVAIMNIGSFVTYARIVTEHNTAEKKFTYNSEVKLYRPKHHYFYLEGKKEFLDVENEWFYDMELNTAYLYPPKNKEPSTSSIRGKVQTYFLNCKNVGFVHLKGLDFFGTTIQFINSSNIIVEDCNFMYPSYSKRMLKDLSEIEGTYLQGDNNTVKNCTFRNTDGHSIHIKGDNCLIENTLFQNIDISCANAPRLGASVYFTGNKNTFRQNTIAQCGCSETLYLSAPMVVEYNYMTATGFLQNDGALIQHQIRAQPNSIARYNWLINSVKFGIRYDKPMGVSNLKGGEKGLSHHNVTYKVGGGLMSKGDKHQLYHNTIGNSEKNDIVVLKEIEPWKDNYNTLVKNNLSGTMSGHRKKPDGELPLTAQSDYISNNWVGYPQQEEISSQLVAPEIFDFRPKKGAMIVNAGVKVKGINDSYKGKAPDIGAYEYGDENYWMAGRQEEKTSFPIPHSGYNKFSKENSLMWKKSYKADSYKIYFGTNKNKLKLEKAQANNIFNPQNLKNSTTYYWKVDAVKGNQVIEGDIWEFTTTNNIEN